VHLVVATSLSQQMQQHADPEPDRRPDTSLPIMVERHARPNRYHADTWQVGFIASLPLQEGKIGNFVSGLRQCQGEIAVPALCTSNRPGVQAVVDNAEPHRGLRLAGAIGGAERVRYPCSSYGAAASVQHADRFAQGEPMHVVLTSDACCPAAGEHGRNRRVHVATGVVRATTSQVWLVLKLVHRRDDPVIVIRVHALFIVDQDRGDSFERCSDLVARVYT
jgi:hypothetical protein